MRMHRFPSNPVRRQLWLTGLNLKESDVKSHYKICSQHFLLGDASMVPSVSLGEKFVSPKRPASSRAKRAIKQQRLEFDKPKDISTSSD